MTDSILPQTLSTADVARRLKLNPATVARWAHTGRLRGTKTPQGWRFHAADIEAFVAAPLPLTLHLESRVAEVAAAQGLSSIGALARAAHLHRSTVANWWGHLPARLIPYTLCRLCKTLDVQPGDLMVVVDDRQRGAL